MTNLNSKQIIFLITTFLILCISLRNLSSIYYLITSILIFYLLSDKIFKFFSFNNNLFLFYSFIYYSIFIIFISFIYYYLGFATDGDLSENIPKESVFPFSGVPRMMLLPLLTFILIYNLKSNDEFLKILKLVLFVYLLASVVIILQSFIFGPIEWLGQPSHRGGYRRYTSIIGSITVFGSIIGYSIIFVLLDKKIINKNLYKIIFFTILSAGCFISLSRVGIFIYLLSILLVIFYLFIFKSKNFIKLSFFLIVVFFFTFIFLSSEPEYMRLVDTALGLTFGESFMIFSEERNLIKDTRAFSYETVFSLRLFHFFSNSISHYTDFTYTSYGPLLYFTGVGLHGAAGVMGLPGASPHSGLADLFFMGGPVYLILFLLLYIDTQVFLFKNKNYGYNAVLLLCNILFLINLIFVSGTLFQPSISIVFWISIAYIYFQRNLKN